MDPGQTVWIQYRDTVAHAAMTVACQKQAQLLYTGTEPEHILQIWRLKPVSQLLVYRAIRRLCLCRAAEVTLLLHDKS